MTVNPIEVVLSLPFDALSGVFEFIILAFFIGQAIFVCLLIIMFFLAKGGKK